MNINLHELANRPGFGKAQTVLKKAGFFDPHADTGEECEWIMGVSGQMPVDGTVRVMARNEEEAMEKAIAEASSPRFSWDYDEGAQDVCAWVSK